jgi:tetratricopeptide (TPR) repeat protein
MAGAGQKQSPSDSGAHPGGGGPAGLELARSLCLQADLLPYGSAAKESLYRKSLEAGRKEGPGPWQVDPLVGLAKIQAARKDFAKAADFYSQVYEVTLKYYGPDHGATAAAKIQWARSRMRTGEVGAAIEQIEEAIPVARREFPPDSLRLWNILHDAVHACNDGKAFRQAEAYTVEALAINERLHLPPTSERWGMLYWDLGRAKKGEGNYRDAVAAFEKAEADFQQFTDTRARQVQEDIEQLKAEQRGDAAPAK